MAYRSWIGLALWFLCAAAISHIVADQVYQHVAASNACGMRPRIAVLQPLPSTEKNSLQAKADTTGTSHPADTKSTMPDALGLPKHAHPKVAKKETTCYLASLLCEREAPIPSHRRSLFDPEEE